VKDIFENPNSIYEAAGNLVSDMFVYIHGGQEVLPTVVSLDAELKPSYVRLVAASGADIENEKSKLTTQEGDENGRALVYFGGITLDGVERTCIIADIIEYSSNTGFMMIVPFEIQSGPESFKIFKFKLSAVKNMDADERGMRMNLFYDGVEGHPKGVELYARYFSE